LTLGRKPGCFHGKTLVRLSHLHPGWKSGCGFVGPAPGSALRISATCSRKIGQRSLAARHTISQSIPK
jgi:hypothetical protein